MARRHYGITLSIPASAYRKAKAKVARDERVWKRHNPNPRGGRSLPAGTKRYATNRDRAVVEVYEFRNRKKAGPFVAYVKSGKLTNFTGVRLCTIVHRTGAKGVTAQCIDGRTYVGRSNGEGMWIRMRPKAGR